MEEFEFKPGDAVAHEGDVWVVESARAVTEVTRGVNGTDNRDEKSGYRIIRLRWCGDIYEIERKGVAACEVSALSEPETPLTAKAYAEKLRAVFGAAARELDLCENIVSCSDMRCEECPFSQKRRKAVGYSGNCDALAWYHPDLAVKLMDEWMEEKNKPKGKTYLQDLVEKMPNVFINKNHGIPEACRKRLYNRTACTDCMPGIEACRKCWNEVMPEDDNAKE